MLQTPVSCKEQHKLLYTINMKFHFLGPCVKSITLTTQIIISLGCIVWRYMLSEIVKTNKTHIKLSHSRHYERKHWFISHRMIAVCKVRYNMKGRKR